VKKSSLYILLLIQLFSVSSLKAAGDKKVLYPSAPVVEYVRMTFYSSIENSDTADTFNEFFAKPFVKEDLSKYPFLLAFYGASETLIAKHSYNPYKKVKYLNTGLEKIGRALAADPENLEIRFLRYSILYHLPAILGYSKERMADALYIVEKLSKREGGNLPPKILQGIVEFMLESNDLTQYERNQIRRLYASLN